MQANAGDWLIIKSHSDGAHSRRGLILETRDGGAPPFRVRWIDQDHEVLFFPGPDAEVLTPEQLAAVDHAQSQRLADVQAAITFGKS